MSVGRKNGFDFLRPAPPAAGPRDPVRQPAPDQETRKDGGCPLWCTPEVLQGEVIFTPAVPGLCPESLGRVKCRRTSRPRRTGDRDAGKARMHIWTSRASPHVDSAMAPPLGLAAGVPRWLRGLIVVAAAVDPRTAHAAGCLMALLGQVRALGLAARPARPQPTLGKTRP